MSAGLVYAERNLEVAARNFCATKSYEDREALQAAALAYTREKAVEKLAQAWKLYRQKGEAIVAREQEERGLAALHRLG